MKPECSAAEMEAPDPECPVTLWSDWGPCSASCGSGVRIRARQLLVDGAAERRCSAPGRKQLSEQQACTVRAECVFDAAAARDACAAEIVAGPCRGSYERYAFDAERGTCGRFMFGGCRGNANNFVTEDECRRTCIDAGSAAATEADVPTPVATTTVRPAAVDCQLSEWSEWSRCSVACGMGVSERSRRILAEARNGGQPCPVKLVKRRRCYQGSC